MKSLGHTGLTWRNNCKPKYLPSTAGSDIVHRGDKETNRARSNPISKS